MSGKEKKKYTRHLSVRIALGILLMVFLVQLVALIVNSIGFFASSLLDDGSNMMRAESFIQESMDPEVFLEALKLREKTPDFITQEMVLRSYVDAMNGQVARLMIFTGDEEEGYYVLTDINQKFEREIDYHIQEDIPEHAFMEKLEGIPAGLVESVFEHAVNVSDENQVSKIFLSTMNQENNKELATLLFGIPELSEMMLPGFLRDAEDGSRLMFLMVLDPLGLFLGPMLHVLILVVVTLVSTLLLLLVLIFWLNRRVVSPLKKIKEAAVGFTTQTRENENPENWTYEAPKIRTKDEIQELGDTVCGMANEIKKTVGEIVSATKEKERVGAELDLAAKIQSSMLPRIFPAFPDRNDFDIYASMNPAREVGGDFYDYFFLDENRLYMVMADVSGKGIPASLFMMSSMLVLSSLAKGGLGPAEILFRANNQIAGTNKAAMFVTAWVGILDLDTGVLRAANAGHEYPAVKKRGEGFTLLKDRHGFVLGEIENMKYHEYEIRLENGDAIFVYTDGVPEANNKNEEMFGTQRMLDALNHAPGEAPHVVVTAVSEALRDYAGDADPFDDVTMLCLKYLRDPVVPA